MRFRLMHTTQALDDGGLRVLVRLSSLNDREESVIVEATNTVTPRSAKIGQPIA